MRLTIESPRSPFQTAECAFASLMLHAGLVGIAIGLIGGGRGLPADGRYVGPLFLVPPDRHESPDRGQTELLRAGQAGGYFSDGSELDGAGIGSRTGGRPFGRLDSSERSSAIGLVPFGPPARPADSVFTLLQVDRTVERYEESAAPIYPPRLSALGLEGHVQATFVVDTTGQVDLTSVRVLESDHPEFSESVRTALGGMRFRPALRGGKAVRQLVEQRFNFRLALPGQAAGQIS